MADSEPALSIYSATEGFNSLRHYWELFQNHPNSDIDYFISEAEADQDRAKPLAAVYFEKGKPAAILVGKLSYAPEIARLGFRKITGPRLKSFLVPTGGLLWGGKPFNYDAFLHSLMTLLKSSQFDLIRIGGIEISSLLNQSHCQLVPICRRTIIPFRQLSWRLSTKLGYDIFLKQHKKYKKTQKQLLNKIRQTYENQFEMQSLSNPADIERIIADIKTISKKSWQEKSGERPFDPESLKRRLKHFADNKQFACYFLRIKRIPVAFLYGFYYRGTLFLEGTAFDPDFRNHSVGTLLFMRAIDEAFMNRDIDYIDFGAGNDQGKALYCDIMTEIVTLSIYAPRPVPIMSNLLKSSIEFAHQKARDLLKKTNLADKLRQRSRQRV